jgi:putative membrane protein
MSLLLISRHRRPILAATAVGTAAVLALAGPVTAAFSDASGTPVVQTSETVKANLDASGKLDVARLFSQIEASGKGRVSLSDPTSTDGLRNLDGWGAPSTKDGKASYNFSVDGEKSFRTVAKYKEKLPVSINATYTLDGKQIKPGDLAGKSGKLSVTYKIVNMTGEPTDISYPDGHGKNVTETVHLICRSPSTPSRAPATGLTRAATDTVAG